MLAYTDLHLHSCLSPCAQDDMTPWNLVGMAKVKGLDVVAITDHNAACNLPQAMAAGEAYGVEVIPGMEVTTREEVHMLAYFYTLEAALAFGEEVYRSLPQVANDAQLFGKQIIVGEEDQPVGELDKLLITATSFTLDQFCQLVKRHHGLVVPAHINRTTNGMMGALGIMPMLPEFPVVEVAKGLECPAYATKGRLLLHSSDAHCLEDIQERTFALDVKEATAQGVLARLALEGA